MAQGFGELGGASDIVEYAIGAFARMRKAAGPDGPRCRVLRGARRADLDELFVAITRRGLRPVAPGSHRSCSRWRRPETRWPIGSLEEQGRSLAERCSASRGRLRMIDEPSSS